MKRIALDIETDGIDAKIVHCVCGQDVDTGEKFEWYEITMALTACLDYYLHMMLLLCTMAYHLMHQY